MRIFHDIQIVREGRVYLPHAMRAALGWHQEQSLYCWSRVPQSAGGTPNQVWLSVVEPAPRALWSLAVRFRDETGLLAKLTELLSDEHINIVTSRCSSDMQGHEFSVEMEIDTHAYVRTHDTTLRELHTRIACTFIRQIVFEPDGTPRLTIIANRELGGIGKIENRDQTSIDDRHVVIPEPFLQRTDDYFRRRYGPLKARSGESAELRAAVAADVDSGVLEVTFFYPHTGYKHIRLRTFDQIGTLRAIADTLQNFHFNILQAYHRTIHRGYESQTDLLVRYAPPDGIMLADAPLLERIRSVLHKSVPLQRLKYKLIDPEPCEPPDRRPAVAQLFRIIAGTVFRKAPPQR